MRTGERKGEGRTEKTKEREQRSPVKKTDERWKAGEVKEQVMPRVPKFMARTRQVHLS